MPTVADEGGHGNLISERGCTNVTQLFLSVGDFFHTSNPRAVKLAEMNFKSTVDSNIVKEFILMSFYINEAVLCCFLCLNWRPMSVPLGCVLLVCRYRWTKFMV